MSASQIDPHHKIRAGDVAKVARGEQAPRPAHDYGTVSPPPPSSSSSSVSLDSLDDKVENTKTAPFDSRFPFTNQTRLCYARYLEYQWCVHDKGKNARECGKFAKYYRSICPSEWIERWNEQRENGTFPGPI